MQIGDNNGVLLLAASCSSPSKSRGLHGNVGKGKVSCLPSLFSPSCCLELGIGLNGNNG